MITFLPEHLDHAVFTDKMKTSRNNHDIVGFIHQVAFDNYLSEHGDPTEIEYYLCGPPMMIDAVQKMLDSLGVDPEMTAFDDFG